MKNLYKIGLLLAAIVLSGSTAGGAGTAAVHDTGRIQPAQQGPFESTQPAGKAFLFSVQHAGETGINVLERLPKPHTAENLQHLNGLHARAALLKQPPAVWYACAYKALYQQLTVRKLIYPFHSHW